MFSVSVSCRVGNAKAGQPDLLPVKAQDKVVREIREHAKDKAHETLHRYRERAAGRVGERQLVLEPESR